MKLLVHFKLHLSMWAVPRLRWKNSKHNIKEGIASGRNSIPMFPKPNVERANRRVALKRSTC